MPFYFAKSDQVIWQSQYYCSATIRMNYNLHWIFVTRGFAANHLDLVTGRAVNYIRLYLKATLHLATSNFSPSVVKYPNYNR